MPTREQIVEQARTLLGTPFHHQGRAPGIGLDCAGVAVCACQALGIEYADRKGYARVPSQGVFIRTLESVTDRVELVDVQPGDLMSFRWTTEPQHVAIVSQVSPDIMLIHAWEAAGKVVENRLDELWRSRLTGCHRLRGIE